MPGRAVRAASILALVLGLFTPRPSSAAGADPLPTQDEIHQLFDQGKYPLVLQQLQRALLIIDAMATIRDVRVLESAATGSTAETKKRVGDLGTRAHELMADAVKRLKGPVDDIEKSANTVVQVEAVTGDPRTGGARQDPK